MGLCSGRCCQVVSLLSLFHLAPTLTCPSQWLAFEGDGDGRRGYIPCFRLGETDEGSSSDL